MVDLGRKVNRFRPRPDLLGFRRFASSLAGGANKKMAEKESYGTAAPVNVEVVAPETLNAGYTFDAVYQVR